MIYDIEIINEETYYMVYWIINKESFSIQQHIGFIRTVLMDI